MVRREKSRVLRNGIRVFGIFILSSFNVAKQQSNTSTPIMKSNMPRVKPNKQSNHNAAQTFYIDWNIKKDIPTAENFRILQESIVLYERHTIKNILQVNNTCLINARIFGHDYKNIHRNYIGMKCHNLIAATIAIKCFKYRLQEIDLKIRLIQKWNIS